MTFVKTPDPPVHKPTHDSSEGGYARESHPPAAIDSGLSIIWPLPTARDSLQLGLPYPPGIAGALESLDNLLIWLKGSSM